MKANPLNHVCTENPKKHRPYLNRTMVFLGRGFLGVVPHLQLSEAFFSSSSSPRESILNVHISLTICLLVMGIITTVATYTMYTIYTHTICTELTEILVGNPECKMNLHTHKNISLLAITESVHPWTN